MPRQILEVSMSSKSITSCGCWFDRLTKRVVQCDYHLKNSVTSHWFNVPRQENRGKDIFTLLFETNRIVRSLQDDINKIKKHLRIL